MSSVSLIRQHVTTLGGVLVVLGLGLGGCAAARAADPARLIQLDEDAHARPEALIASTEALEASLSIDAPELIEVLRIEGRMHVRMGHMAPAEQVARRLDRVASAAQDAVQRATATVAAGCLRADIVRIAGPLSRADLMFDEVLPTLKPAISGRVKTACYVGAAAAKANLGRLDEAVGLYQSAIREADAAGWQGQRARARSGLAHTLYRAGQIEQGLVVNNDARRVAEQNQDWMSLSEAMTVHSILIGGQGRGAEELQALEQSIEFARRAGSDRDEGLGLANLADYYLQLKDYPRALELARRALPLSRAVRDPVGERLAQVNSGLALISMHRKDEGMQLIRHSLENDRRADEIFSLVESLQDIGPYLERAGYWVDAYEAYAELRKLNELASKRARQDAIVEMQERYEADRRRRERTLLSDDIALKEEQYRREGLLFRLWTLLAAMAAVALVLGVLLYRRMQATQRQLRHTHERLKAQSEQDPLTGLANRRHAQAVMARSTQAQGTLLLLDLDHFKRINDHFGHAAGDAVLIEVARRLKAVVREGDSVVRWGGEEFLILLDNGPAEQADLLAQRLLAALASLPVLADERHIAISGSIGYAEFPLQPHRLAVPWETALDLIDAVMYLAKTQGRNRACGLHDVPVQDLAGLHRLMQDVDGAWRDGRLSVVQRVGPQQVGDL